MFTPRPHNAKKARYCSQACVAPEMGNRYRARLAAVFIEEVNPLEVFERDGWICQLCDLPIDRAAAAPAHGSRSLDHRLPLSRGGKHMASNLQAAHWLCNTVKNSREELSWPDVALLRKRLALVGVTPIAATAS